MGRDGAGQDRWQKRVLNLGGLGVMEQVSSRRGTAADGSPANLN